MKKDNITGRQIITVSTCNELSWFRDIWYPTAALWVVWDNLSHALISANLARTGDPLRTVQGLCQSDRFWWSLHFSQIFRRIERFLCAPLPSLACVHEVTGNRRDFLLTSFFGQICSQELSSPVFGQERFIFNLPLLFSDSKLFCFHW